MPFYARHPRKNELTFLHRLRSMEVSILTSASVLDIEVKGPKCIAS